LEDGHSTVPQGVPAPGQEIPLRTGRYDIGKEIARGGIGAIREGRDRLLGREVAIKILREDCQHDLTMVRRFVEEAQIGGQLQHPGIIPVYVATWSVRMSGPMSSAWAVSCA
jgi:hypothetical protein